MQFFVLTLLFLGPLGIAVALLATPDNLNKRPPRGSLADARAQSMASKLGQRCVGHHRTGKGFLPPMKRRQQLTLTAPVSAPPPRVLATAITG